MSAKLQKKKKNSLLRYQLFGDIAVFVEDVCNIS